MKLVILLYPGIPASTLFYWFFLAGWQLPLYMYQLVWQLPSIDT